MNIYSEVVDGLAGWLNFEMRAKRDNLFSEAYLANPLGQLLNASFPGRILTEMQHPILADKMQGPGKRPQVDFVVTGNYGKWDLAIETKWISKSPTLHQDIIKDVIRLDLLVPTYAREGILIVAGNKRDFSDFFEDNKFKKHPDQPSSNPLLPIENHTAGSVRFLPTSAFRKDIYNKALKPFRGVEISQIIRLQRSGPFPRNPNNEHYEVYLWKIRTDRLKEASFLPEEHFDI
ncbi:MAG: hypothetical protein KJ950_00745 [Proteobacteria bacterium]|nr:hypothetical protein [Pseudomonadota bacterium]